MKLTLFPLLLLILLAASVSAQPVFRFDEELTSPRCERGTGRPNIGVDHLMWETPFGMKRSELEERLKGSLFVITRSDESGFEASASMSGITWLNRFDFLDGKLLSIQNTMTGPGLLTESIRDANQRSERMLELRSLRVDTIDGRPVYFHRTSSGVWIRTTVRNIDSTEIVFESGPAEPGYGPHPQLDPALVIDAISTGRDTLASVYPPDEFLPGIGVDMTSGELERWAIDGDRARSMTLTVTMSPMFYPLHGFAKCTIALIRERMTDAIHRRSLSATMVGMETIYIHERSDGSRIRTSVEQMSYATFTIRSGIIE